MTVEYNIGLKIDEISIVHSYENLQVIFLGV